MRPRTLVVLLLFILLLSLPPLARLSPPDPTWFGGFWDNGDYDDVVLLICGAAADLPASPEPPRATSEVVAIVDPGDPAKPALASLGSTFSRAPPRV
jgi:hypothetical protein